MSVAAQTWSIWWGATWRYKIRSIWAMVSLVIANLGQRAFIPLVVAAIVDRLVELSEDGGSSIATQFSNNGIWALFGLFVAIRVVENTTYRAMAYSYIQLQSNTIRDLEIDIHSKILRLPHSYHQQNQVGALVSKARRFTDSYESFTDMIYWSLGPVVLQALFATAIILFRSPLVGIILAISLVVFVFGTIRFLIWKSKFTEAEAEAESLVTAELSDQVSNIEVIEAFGVTANESRRFRDSAEDSRKKRTKSWMTNTFMNIGHSIYLVLLEIAILALTIDRALNGDLSIGDVVLVQLYVLPLLGDLYDLGENLAETETALSNGAEMTEVFAEVEKSYGGRTLDLTNEPAILRMSNIAFAYPDDLNRGVLSNFSLEVQPGESIGLVGPSGGGKSTIVKLMLGFIKPQSGVISLADVDAVELTHESRAEHFAYVSQESVLFHRSVAENIAYSTNEIDRDRLYAAAKAANAHEFIEGLTDGYETMVGERGTRLSGGQRQRIAMARAFYADAPILLLDEATSALDSETEVAVQQALSKLLEDRTVIVIAHRLSTVSKLDRIVVVEDGQIVEQGSHSELIDSSGRYAALWEKQTLG